MICSYHSCTVAVVQFNQTSPSYSPVCPGDTLVLTCIASGSGVAFWRGDDGGISRVDSEERTYTIGSFLVRATISGTTVVSIGTIDSVPLSLSGTINVDCSPTINLADFVTLNINITG